VTALAPSARLFLVVILAGFPLLGGVRIAAAGGLRDEILENKYRWGDYGIYMGWYDPWGEQFDVHGAAAYPLGGKVRLRWAGWLRFEADFSYYRRSGDATFFDIVNVPKFDGLMLAATIQGTAGKLGPFRPYFGGGPVIASLTNTFAVIIREVEDLEPPGGPELIDKFAIASWNELDLGVSAVVGIDIHLSSRAFPFFEYRHLFGQFDTNDIRIGAFRYSPDELKYADGRPLPVSYDWSGPVIMGGLKVRF
jgi:hypothetical protein